MEQRSVMTDAEVAKVLHVNRRAIKTLREQHGLPFFIVGKRYRYRLDWLREWMEVNQTAIADPEMIKHLAV